MRIAPLYHHDHTETEPTGAGIADRPTVDAPVHRSGRVPTADGRVAVRPTVDLGG